MPTLELATRLGQTRAIPTVTRESIGRARTWTGETLARLGVDTDTIGSALLAVSELLTNVHQYAPGPADLTLTPGPGFIRLQCADRGLGFKRPDTIPTPDPAAEHGRGLAILTALDPAWSARRRLGGGTRVTLTLHTEQEAPR